MKNGLFSLNQHYMLYIYCRYTKKKKMLRIDVFRKKNYRHYGNKLGKKIHRGKLLACDITIDNPNCKTKIHRYIKHDEKT